ncbi:DUF5134 domain-containing protein [Trebonia kvetii]|uniref:DUF5134 domain-containing protein n=1 Tax=Trebonia kvetii TaxID=2480626 RepID=A0A6P2C6G4_9ACTN|nr:DUF5134 domain-containing protein [Trebonia kvetii]TVZ07032.1 DUF5134 domain-containing protein [Trebonia kvetii]
MTPAWILDALAALMLVVAAVSAARIVLARPWRCGAFVADTDVAHLLMAIAMAGMLTPRLGTLPDTAWEAVFSLLAVWFASRVAREARTNGRGALAGAHCAPHLVHSVSMLYMFLAATAPPARTGTGEGMGGMSAGAGSAAMTLSLPTLAFVFAFILVGYAVWDLDQLSGRRYSTGRHDAGLRVSLAGVAPVGAAQVGVGQVGVGQVAASETGARAAARTYDARHADQAGAASSGGTVGAVDGCGRDGAPRTGGAAAFLLSPAVTVGCRIAMGVTMAFMLLIAL